MKLNCAHILLENNIVEAATILGGESGSIRPVPSCIKLETMPFRGLSNSKTFPAAVICCSEGVHCELILCISQPSRHLLSMKVIVLKLIHINKFC